MPYNSAYIPAQYMHGAGDFKLPTIPLPGNWFLVNYQVPSGEAGQLGVKALDDEHAVGRALHGLINAGLLRESDGIFGTLDITVQNIVVGGLERYYDTVYGSSKYFDRTGSLVSIN